MVTPCDKLAYVFRDHRGHSVDRLHRKVSFRNMFCHESPFLISGRPLWLQLVQLQLSRGEAASYITMAERPKLLYIVVQDEESENEVKVPSPRYTRPLLQSTLQLMGCKPRHAFKVLTYVDYVFKNKNEDKGISV